MIEYGVNKKITLKLLYERYHDTINSLDKQIYKLFNFLLSMKIDDITINKPFTYAPKINLFSNSNCINEEQVFPIGDSLFTGNPKIGNGLSSHIMFINELVEELYYKKI